MCCDLEVLTLSEIAFNNDGLVHISQIAKERVEKVTDYLTEGQEVKVLVLDVDRGRIKLSMKELVEDEPAEEVEEATDEPNGNVAEGNSDESES